MILNLKLCNYMLVKLWIQLPSLVRCRFIKQHPLFFDDTQEGADLFALRKPGNIYTRITNPTTAAFEERIAALEGGVGALATASGMAAVTYTILALAHAGDHVVAASTIYGGTFNLLKETLPRYGITTTFVDVDNLEEVEAAINDNTKLVLIEPWAIL